MNRITKFAEDHPWVFLVAAGFFAYQSFESFRGYLAMRVIREATEITKDAADA